MATKPITKGKVVESDGQTFLIFDKSIRADREGTARIAREYEADGWRQMFVVDIPAFMASKDNRKELDWDYTWLGNMYSTRTSSVDVCMFEIVADAVGSLKHCVTKDKFMLVPFERRLRVWMYDGLFYWAFGIDGEGARCGPYCLGAPRGGGRVILVKKPTKVGISKDLLTTLPTANQ